MKLTVSSLLFLTATASADTVTLQEVSAAGPAPKVVATEALCKDDGDRIRTTRSKFAGHEIAVLHECGSSDLMTSLAFETAKGDWQTYQSGTIAYRAGNMTDAPLHIYLLSETLTTTKLGGKKVLLHRVDTSHREIRYADDTVASDIHHSRIDVCTVDDSLRCGYAEVECPETGCKAPEIIKGALWLHAKGGRQKFTIEQK